MSLTIDQVTEIEHTAFFRALKLIQESGALQAMHDLIVWTWCQGCAEFQEMIGAVAHRAFECGADSVTGAYR